MMIQEEKFYSAYPSPLCRLLLVLLLFVFFTIADGNSVSSRSGEQEAMPLPASLTHMGHHATPKNIRTDYSSPPQKGDILGAEYPSLSRLLEANSPTEIPGQTSGNISSASEPRNSSSYLYVNGTTATVTTPSNFTNIIVGGILNSSFLWDQQHKDMLAAGTQKGGGSQGDGPYKVSVKVLVIVNGQLRGGPIAWESLQRYLLEHLRADLALLGPPTHYYLDRNITVGKNVMATGRHAANISLQAILSLRRRAKYLWDVEEPDDWGDILSNVSQHVNKSAWRPVLCDELVSRKDVESQFLGGVENCHPGSAGIILLAYRGLAHIKVRDLRLTDHYDWFIYTRSDYVYLCPPPLFSFLSFPGRVFIPNGQEYGGVTDRFSIFHSSIADAVLGVTADVVTNFTWWRNITLERHTCNLERVIYLYLTRRRGIAIHKFDHVAFTVRRTHEDPSRWSLGDSRPQLADYGNLVPKYPDELDLAGRTCDPWKQLKYFNAKVPIHEAMQPENTNVVAPGAPESSRPSEKPTTQPSPTVQPTMQPTMQPTTGHHKELTKNGGKTGQTLWFRLISYSLVLCAVCLGCKAVLSSRLLFYFKPKT